MLIPTSDTVQDLTGALSKDQSLIAGVVPSVKLEGEHVEVILVADKSDWNVPAVMILVQGGNVALHGENDELAARVTAVVNALPNFKDHPDWKPEQ